MNNKKAKIPDDQEIHEDEISDVEDEDINMDVDDGTLVNLDAQGFPMQDDDFHGIRQQLEQLFTNKSSVQLSKLADALIAQNSIGTILKASEPPEDDNDDWTVFSLVSCYSMTRVNNNEALSSLRDFLIAKCKSSSASKEDKQKFIDIIDNSWNQQEKDVSNCQSCVGYFINERYLNLPFQELAPLMFGSLMEEVKSAKKSMRQVRHDFTHYVMISKINKFTDDDSSNQKETEVVYSHSEDEHFAKEAILSFDFNLVNDFASKKERRILVLTSHSFHQVMNRIIQGEC